MNRINVYIYLGAAGYEHTANNFALLTKYDSSERGEGILVVVSAGTIDVFCTKEHQ